MNVELRKLEGEYTMYFAGRSPRPPVEQRARVEALFKKWERGHVDNLAQKFRLNTLQSRFHTFVELWDRAMRAREEGRRGPLVYRPSTPQPPPPPAPVPETPPATPKPEPRAGGVLYAASFSDPAREPDKLKELYRSLMEARRTVGEGEVSYERFADLVATQVRALKRSGDAEVDLRVALKDGKVSLTARKKKSGE
jgi:hypothetical protein